MMSRIHACVTFAGFLAQVFEVWDEGVSLSGVEGVLIYYADMMPIIKAYGFVVDWLEPYVSVLKSRARLLEVDVEANRADEKVATLEMKLAEAKMAASAIQASRETLLASLQGVDRVFPTEVVLVSLGEATVTFRFLPTRFSDSVPCPMLFSISRSLKRMQ